MPELSVTEEQLERLEALRADLEATFVDGYAHVRRRDVVDYLLDTHTPPAEHVGDGPGTAGPPDAPVEIERRVRDALDRAVRDEEGGIDYPALQSVARETEGVKGSGMDAEAMYEAVLEAKVREAEASGIDGIEIPGRDEQPDDSSEADTGTDEAGGADPTDPADGLGGSSSADGADASGSGETDEEGDESEAGTAAGESSEGASGNGSGGGSQLQQMMNLLETHDDKWRKAESGDAPYEVDLPDGGTEAARTKDDIKRILFTNY